MTYQIKQEMLHPSFEDDVIMHNRLLEVVSEAIENRIASQYEFNDSFKAIQAVAQLIKTKADKQMMIMLNAIEDIQS